MVLETEAITQSPKVGVCALANFLESHRYMLITFAMKPYVQPCEAPCICETSKRGVSSKLGSAGSLQTCVVLRHGEGDQEYDEKNSARPVLA
jgi:hypothetical protein